MVIPSVVNAPFLSQLLHSEKDCNISSLEEIPIPVANLLHLCGSWMAGWSESSPRQLTLNSSLKQCMKSFSKLWPFSLPSFHGKYCPAIPKSQ